MRTAQRPRYWSVLLQPFFVVCSALLIAHQIAQKILHYPIPWIDAYLDPLLCMPILLSIFLADQRWKRSNINYYFSYADLIVITLIFAIIFEFLFPKWKKDFTSDYQDIIYYFTGSFLFYFFNKNNTQAK